mgnify:CR=1 FL=1
MLALLNQLLDIVLQEHRQCPAQQFEHGAVAFFDLENGTVRETADDAPPPGMADLEP